MILVTGATGLNGKAIVREFARQKHEVRALVRDPKRASMVGLGGLAGVELVEGDMRRAQTLGAALEGVDRVLMISTAAEDMTETQCRFVDACRQAGVAHVVKFSGAESNIGYDATKFRFTRMHEEVERYLQGAGMAWTHLRPSQFMQVFGIVASCHQANRMQGDGRRERAEKSRTQHQTETERQVAICILRPSG